MSNHEIERISEMRATFDSAFAEPLEPDQSAGYRSFLAIVVGQTQYAIDADAVAGIIKAPSLISVSGRNEFVGLAGARGRLVAVFDLSQLVERRATQSDESWMLLSRDEPDVAFIANGFETHLRAPEEALEDPGPSAPDFVTQTLRLEGQQTRWVIDLDALLDHLDGAETTGDTSMYGRTAS